MYDYVPPVTRLGQIRLRQWLVTTAVVAIFVLLTDRSQWLILGFAVFFALGLTLVVAVVCEWMEVDELHWATTQSLHMQIVLFVLGVIYTLMTGVDWLNPGMLLVPAVIVADLGAAGVSWCWRHCEPAPAEKA